MPKKKLPSRRRRPRPVRADIAASNEAAAQLLEQGRLRDGLVLLDELITAGRANFQTWRLAGNGLLAAGEFAQALDAYSHALRASPEPSRGSGELEQNIEVKFQLARSLFGLGATTAAVEQFRELVDKHGSPVALCNLATILPGCPESSNSDILQVRRAFSASLGSEALPATVPSQPKAEHEPIRVGYVSSFFARENYMKPVWSLLNAHDRKNFVVELFCDGHETGATEWFHVGKNDTVHRTRDLTNQLLIELIRSRQLDVLVDLNGYSIPERLPIYAQRLARVGIAWFNMYATSGLPALDYIVGDECVIPESEEVYYSEQVVRVPLSYLTFDVTYAAPPVSAPPSAGGQPFTFGSLISQYKITAAVFDAWSTILQRAPKSRLMLGNRALASTSNREYLARQFADRGIDTGRIHFLTPGPHAEFLRHYDRMDLALDAFPYNGGTTTTEALWQGVPVVAFNGDRWAARTSYTLLHNAGLSEFVASDVEGYVDLAVRWALDDEAPLRLGSLRANMRDQLRKSAVCDSQRLASELEEIFRSVLLG